MSGQGAEGAEMLQTSGMWFSLLAWQAYPLRKTLQRQRGRRPF
jgi:hypothetical protein